MPIAQAPVRDIRFVINDLLNMEQHMAGLDHAMPLDAETMSEIVEQSARFLYETCAPLNRNADEQGCRYENGQVTTPDGFKALYQAYCENGWCSLDADEEFGGQGLPYLAHVVIGELNSYFSPAWSNYPGLTHGVREMLDHFGTDDLKSRYMPQLVSGQWAGTMCLTEPHCGTDLGMLTTSATPADDGSYSVTGTKIFITSGEHDLTDNIVHMVLARADGAVEGVKGISLFLVPKRLSDENSELGDSNHVSCASIEHKMGLNGSVTCVMNFDGATGWLVGTLHDGLKAMFTMMNSARLNTGIQGMAASQAAYDGALVYARERLQSRSISGAKYPDKAADPILVHADVRRMLLTQRVIAEGCRAMAYLTAMHIENAKFASDAGRRERSQLVGEFLTPIAKAFMTETAMETTDYGIQIFGGHGYIREHGMEQWHRDAKIFTLYEGTTGIQALDLVGRKMMHNQRGTLGPLGEDIQAWIEANPNARYTEALNSHIELWTTLSSEIAGRAAKAPDDLGAASVDFLMLSGYVVLAWLWARMDDVASRGEGDHGAVFYSAKQKSARFYFEKILPRCDSLAATIRTGSGALMAFEDEEF